MLTVRFVPKSIIRRRHLVRDTVDRAFIGAGGRAGHRLWLSKGKTNRDIAQILGLSPRTVDKHLEQIYSKLGVENRTAAAAIAVSAKNRKT